MRTIRNRQLLLIIVVIVAIAFTEATSKDIGENSNSVPVLRDSTLRIQTDYARSIDADPAYGSVSDKSGSTNPNRHLFSSGGGVRQIGPFNINLSVGQPVVGSSDIGPFSIESGGMITSQTHPLCGDADGSGYVDIDDIMYLVNYIFLGGPPSQPIEIGDVNCYQQIDIDDVIYLANYVFLGGHDPCDTNGDGIPDC